MAHDPDDDRPAKTLKDADDPESVAASASLVWGTIAMFTWLLPPVGVLVAIAGLVLGHRGWNASNGDRARLGVVLSIMSLLLAAWLSVWIVIAAYIPYS